MQRIRKLLIANRGEIACRIARSARRLGLAVATVHSSAERRARHVREIGESFELGGEPAVAYLDIAAIVAAARKAGADALHPGYGFASENPDLVQAVEDAGLIFVGPSAATMRRLGGKGSAKREAARLGLPVIAGSDAGLTDPAEIVRTVRALGLPLLLKAVAGGGGRGMALIETEDGLDARIAATLREAQHAFGNAELIVERYLPRVRHVEVQIAGDGQGGAIHLFERECTLQRRHQKLIEEAPSAALPAGLREAMLADACRLAAAVGYRGLGTVEFIVSGDRHHFLEVNPRLQVEHPVTEAITGIDLVELQLQIADTGQLPLTQAALRCSGHAFEARLCAEDPDAGFLPATGRIECLEFPKADAALRIDSGVASGDAISPHYDSMIAKLIAHGSDREDARRRLLAALRATRVVGIATNRHFLGQLLQLDATRDSSFDTRLVDALAAERCAAAPAAAGAAKPPFEYLCAAALWWLEQRRAEAAALGCWGQWQGFTGWRLASGAVQPLALPSLLLKSADRQWGVRLSQRDDNGTVAIAIDDAVASTSLERLGGSRHLLQCGDRALELTIIGTATPPTADRPLQTATWPSAGTNLQAAGEKMSSAGEKLHIAGALGSHAFECLPWLGGAAVAVAAASQLSAPMMGKVVAIHVAAGDRVASGQTAIVLESMKMELRVVAPFAATVGSLHCTLGEMVERGAVLAELVADPTEPGASA